jgi:hypothetical protein
MKVGRKPLRTRLGPAAPWLANEGYLCVSGAAVAVAVFLDSLLASRGLRMRIGFEGGWFEGGMLVVLGRGGGLRFGLVGDEVE